MLSHSKAHLTKGKKINSFVLFFFDSVSWNMYSTVEHMGTHYDAPYHFSATGRKTEDIPLDDLHGPLVRIDISEKAKTNSTATVDLSDIQV